MATTYRRARVRVSDCLTPPVDNTGATNVSATLQTWIDGIPDGSTVCFSGSYRIDQKMLLSARNNLTFTGGTFFTDEPTPDGSPIDTTSPYDVASRTRSQWELSGCTNIVFRSMTIQGANPFAGTSDAAYEIALEAQHGFNIISGCDNIEIDSCTITDTYGDFVCIANSTTTNITVHHCTLTRNGRQGISVTGGSNIWIHHNTMSEMRRACFDFEPNASTVIDGIICQYNTIGATRLNWVSSHGGSNVDNVTISNNSLVGDSLVMDVSAEGSGVTRLNWVVDSNTSDTSYSSGAGYVMHFELCENVTVTNNTQPVAGGMALAAYTNCIDVTNQGNTANGGTYTLLDNGSRYVKNCGNRLTLGAFNLPEACVTNFGTPLQYTGLTQWIEAYKDDDVQTDLAVVSTLTDYSGNARHLTATGSGRPTFRANIGGRNIDCYQFDGVDDFAAGASTLSDLIASSGNAYTMFVVFEPTTVSTSSANAYDNDAVVGDTVGVFGLHLHATGPKAQGYNWDGNADVVEKTPIAKRSLVMLRHESGNLYMALDGAAETSVATGSTTDVFTALLLLGTNYSGSGFFSGTINTVEIYNVALTTAQVLDRTNRLYIDWKVGYLYGASDTYTRANGAIGVEELQAKSYSSTNGTWSVVSNQAKLTTADSASGANWAAVDCGISDGTVQVDINAALGGSLLFRWGGTRDYNMLISGGGGDLYLYKNVSDTFTALRSTSGLAATGTRQLKVVLSGSTVQSYYDGVLIWTDTLTNQQTATYHGLFQFASSAPACTWDNLLVTP